tara:strand:- start:2570 stop:3379 length:810 start_codon:yes stop_codon:yes gene_type:complete
MEINIREYVKDLDLSEGESVRSDCPVCNGRNTFTATKEDSLVKYNCYKLGCSIVPGGVPINLTAAEITERLSTLKDGEAKKTIPAFIIPEYMTWSEPSHTKFNRFVSRWGLEHESLDILYDVKDERAVFMIRDERNRLIDAVGRSLNGSLPKWYRYTGNATVFTRCMGEPNGTVILVEDVISAITVAKVRPNVTGMAVLGTNINAAHMEYLQDYTKIIVALDPDATHKSIEYRKEIQSWTGIDTMAMMLQDDIKYKTEEDLLKLKEYTT